MRVERAGSLLAGSLRSPNLATARAMSKNSRRPKRACSQANVHHASIASFNFPVAEISEEKEALHKSCHSFEVAAAPKFGLVSPDQTGFCCAGINFLEKPTVKKEPTVRSRKH